eukprot:SAG11_NODE_37213_length_258_cov_0.635220_1_plen_32_part_10
MDPYSGGKARRIKFEKNGTPKSVFFKDDFFCE